MQCQELEHVLEENGEQSLPAPAQAHLEGCGACRALVSDLERITVAARELPAEVEPPERIWVSLLSHLEAEKIIRPEFTPARSGSKVPWKSRVLRPALAMLAISGLLLAIVIVRLRTVTVTSLGDRNTSTRALPPELTQTKQQLDSIESRAMASTPEPASATNASLRENLKIVNNFIASCERTVRTTPQNDLARDYLSGAYQQKAELLAAIQDSNSTGD
ncbi:MAG TPA: hypothetical protein VOA41_05330 [Candidatus Dormibacteraeota bacterium]|nr:hypothetical protein [Candidatus Dormibacteraeota bacterium]